MQGILRYLRAEIVAHDVLKLVPVGGIDVVLVVKVRLLKIVLVLIQLVHV